MRAARFSFGVVALMALLASAVWWRHQQHATMVRVGGMANACACTQRIEP